MAGVRLAGPGDADDVARLLAAFRSWYGKDTPSDQVMHGVVTRLLRTRDAEYLLAGDGPDGVAQVRYRLSVWTGVEDCWLEDVFVADSARGRGLGRALVEAVVARARERGCKRVQLDVDADNAPARTLYEAVGFRDKAAGGTQFLQLDLG